VRCTDTSPQKTPQGQYTDAILKWARVFTHSTLDFEQRCRELAWFAETAQPFSGDTIVSVGENIETSFWESQFLGRIFTDLTGIHIHHDVVGEDAVVERLMEQLEKGIHHYDIYVSDADLIGTHLRSRKIVNLSRYMAGAGKAYTNPHLDLADFLNLEFGRDYDGNQLQIPDYQFALVYWFRHDWFTDPQVKKDFLNTFGYELGVPLNWAAYEDIAAFFHGRKMTNPNGMDVTAYGHADYGLPGPWLGWRFSDAFFSVAGMGDKGLPNGMPVDEWGIRVENRVPVGASVERGGAINGPAAHYALSKWISLMEQYAPDDSYQLDWIGFGARPARGDIAQTWYWTSIYAAQTPEYNKIGSPVCDRAGNPVWRIAPMPRGRYWESGMKIGYQDAGSWTLPRSTKGASRHASWLWAQFCLSKTVAVKKCIAGGTPVRKSTLYSPIITQRMKQHGGMIEFLRSPMIKKFTDTGPNVPHYPTLSTLWWKNISKAIARTVTPAQALNTLAFQLDSTMATLTTEVYQPRLNPRVSPKEWLDRPGAPKPEKTHPQIPQTIQYDDLLARWQRKE